MKIGIRGNTLKVIQTIYSDVKCSVRINNCLSDVLVIDVNYVLKQGCLISPLIFNLYINDMITEVNKLRRGININGKLVSVLLYADDIVFHTQYGRDLQGMLDVVNKWCKDWGLLVNTSKSIIVHFRQKGLKVIRFPFECGNCDLNVVYNYLGLWFTDDLNYKYIVEQVAVSVHRALDLLIAKSKCVGGFPFKCYTKLYQSAVQSILPY